MKHAPLGLLHAALLCIPFAPLTAELQLLDGKVWVQGQYRLRLEYRENNVAFHERMDADSDLWVVQRLRLGLAVRPCSWARLYGELQDAREFDSTRFPNNVNLEQDELDWRQGWVELGHAPSFPLGLKIGRQELSYGDERLVGAFDWNNIGRVFDAAKLRWQASNFWVEAFAANVVLNSYAFGRREDSFDDRTYWQDDFYGLYAQTLLLPFHLTEGFLFYRDKNNRTHDGPAREIWTLGARLKSRPRLLPWDYYGEIAGQLGEIDGPGLGAPQGVARRFGDNSLKPAVDHCALAAVIGGGFTFTNCPARPRLGAEYNFASGDRDPTDGKNSTFDNLYPTNHKFFGYMDLFAWKNLHSPRFTVSASPHKTLSVQLDYHLFWLAEERDFWYRANQAPVGAPARRDATGGAGRFVGSELDLSFTWTPCPHFRAHGGYSYFARGDFVRDTAAGPNGTDDAHFLYLQTSLHF